MEVVCVGLRDPSAFSFLSGRDFGQFLAALGQVSAATKKLVNLAIRRALA